MSVVSNLDRLCAQIDSRPLFDVRGSVAAVTGGNVVLRGLSLPIGSIVRVAGVTGRVIGFSANNPVVAPFQSAEGLAPGDEAVAVDSKLSVRVGDALLGRVVDALGHPIDDAPKPATSDRRAVDADPPRAMHRRPIDAAVQTGVRSIDSMLTCGVGQRLGIFAGSGVGKSTLLSMLARGTAADRIVVALVGERGREVQDFIASGLGDAMSKSTVVVATGDSSASCRVTAASTATAIAESYRDDGHDVLLMVDSVTRLAMAQREIGLAAGEPPTTRGYPPSVFSMLPKLVERAGRTQAGSITAFYTVLVEGDDLNEPIADTLRGLLDGHIVLRRSLADAGHYPPIDIASSLSRLQNQLVTPESLAATQLVRRHLAIYADNADLINIGAYRAGTDADIDAAIAAKPMIDQFLRQDAAEQCGIRQSHQQLMALAGNHQTGPAAVPANPSPAARSPAAQSPAAQSPATASMAAG